MLSAELSSFNSSINLGYLSRKNISQNIRICVFFKQTKVKDKKICYTLKSFKVPCGEKIFSAVSLTSTRYTCSMFLGRFLLELFSLFLLIP